MKKLGYMGVFVLLFVILTQWYRSYELEAKENYCRDACTDIENKYPEGHFLHSIHEKLTYEECYERCTSMKD